MGCVIYFVLTSGEHPFGSDQTRQGNIQDSDQTRQGNIRDSDQTRQGNIRDSDQTRQRNIRDCKPKLSKLCEISK